ncbi:hypothetical protein [Pseudomonas protegens]|uniref:hypothetical protein n=1 Tax=Pseudomonas protegens TaxID=380021 RepID=UPI0021B07841|nr:hypothetical protein [Pseudomonas protegens]
MNTCQRALLLIKVLVLLSLGTASAWAHNLLEVNEPGYFSTHSKPVQMFAQSASEPDDDDQTTEEGEAQS